YPDHDPGYRDRPATLLPCGCLDLLHPQVAEGDCGHRAEAEEPDDPDEQRRDRKAVRLPRLLTAGAAVGARRSFGLRVDAGQPLLSRREAACLARRDGALGVSVTAATGVALRQHQHVLHGGREPPAAERTGVGRGLAALRTAHGPPAGRLEWAHAPRLRMRVRGLFGE